MGVLGLSLSLSLFFLCKNMRDTRAGSTCSGRRWCFFFLTCNYLHVGAVVYIRWFVFTARNTFF